MQGDDSDSDSDVAFASMDFSGVNFDDAAMDDDNILNEIDKAALSLEERILLLGESADEIESEGSEDISPDFDRVRELCKLLCTGKYTDILKSDSATTFFGGIGELTEETVVEHLRKRIFSYCTNVNSCVEAEILGVAALNMFLQLNYTGPSLDHGLNPAEIVEDPLSGINPHDCFLERLVATVNEPQDHQQEENETSAEEKIEKLTKSKRDMVYQNAVLSELAVEGEWPCQVCEVPYFLLIARSILLTLSKPDRADWTHSIGSDEAQASADYSQSVPEGFSAVAKHLNASHLWCARAGLAHERLLQSRGPSITLWNEVEEMYGHCCATLCDPVGDDMENRSYKDRNTAASIMLESGLAEHHFDREGKGKKAFVKAQELSGLEVEVTGAVGKRTKFQQEATAQMLVKAKSALGQTQQKIETKAETPTMKPEMIEHSEEEIVLEKIKFDDDDENKVDGLTILDQTIILSLCLDVKNNNPADGLTAEQMGAYLARVLHHHDDWMVYSTALLERAWLECEKTHGRERAILQIQALVDQHANRLTVTQATMQSVEDSSPAQDRLKNLHTIVYPPRWLMLRDLAERYAKIGIVTSAAEIFEQLEMWDQVVECYRIAGKESKAEQVIRERLAEAETPRMWAALGDITKDPSYFEKALEISKGRFSDAYVALGKYNFDKGELQTAFDYFQKALKIRPLMPQIWFNLGTVSMQLHDWEMALNAFTEVVQQEPETGDAWANVAAVHMHNKHPAEAYPALMESLKYNRNNWRVWISKLYTCIDLGKYDEAVQACGILMDLRSKKNMAEKIPPLEEKCIKAIVGGALKQRANCQNDPAALQSSTRSLTRIHDLLEKLSSTTSPEPWIWETLAVFNEQVGNDRDVFDNLMKEYRALQTVSDWEKDEFQVKKVSEVVFQIARFHKQEGSRQSLTKCKLLVSGIIKKVRKVYLDDSKIPGSVDKLEKLLEELEGLVKEST